MWDVIVVGGGVAGLTAAGQLARDRRVLVLEARDRFGGRVDTRHEPDWPIPIEAGAEFMHGLSPVLEKLRRRAGAPRLEDPGHHFEGDGHALRPANRPWKKAMELIGQLPKSGPDRSYDALSREPWWRRLADRRSHTLAREFVEGFNAAPASRISAVSLGQQAAAGEKIDGDRLFRIDPLGRGYRRIVDLVIDDVIRHGGALRLSAPVTHISWRRGQVTLTTPHGIERARRAIITIPVGVLRSFAARFSPSLPPEKLAALRALRMGPVLRVVLRFRRLPAAITRRDLTFLHVPRGSVPTFWRAPGGAPILVGWAAGPAVQRLPRDEAARVRAALASLARGLRVPVGSLELDGHRIFDWQRDPLARGAYTFVTPGGLEAPARLAAPVEDTLFFAGEATHTEGASGTVHGAIETGLRAARDAG